ncbi:hypothetical protein BU15DRAFT_79053 [Melanogaster broomeanus]|nr:hypothetical protein BU15DRAFT_79053 [Melanogaster broomeanus]
MLIEAVPSKPSPLLCGLCCLLLIPYAIILFFLSLLSVVEWLAQNYLFHRNRSFNQLFFTSIRRGIAEDLPLKEILLPSAIIRDSAEHRRYIQIGDEILKEIKEEIDSCKVMLSGIRRERLEIQRRTPLSVDKYLQSLSQSQRLQDHLKVLEKNAEEISFYSRTQAAFDHTGYHGFADWAEKTSKTHEHILVTVGQVAFIGASLTYGAIFSSTRGNLGLMCYAFALFNCGFIVPTVALLLLKWASLRPKEALFSSPHLWTPVLNVFVYGSVAAVGAAICLLNVSLCVLHFSAGPDGQITDAKLEFGIAPPPAGSIALVCLAVALVVALVAGLFHYLANGWKLLVGDFVGNRRSQGHGLVDYVLV